MQHSALRSLQHLVLVALGASACDSDALPLDHGCESGFEAILDEDMNPTGFVRCEGGMVVRQEAIAAPGGGPGTCASATPPQAHECRSDLECGEFGRCHAIQGGAACICARFCRTDDDCGAAKVCLHPAVGAGRGVGQGTGQCVDADCLGPEHCDSGICALTQRVGGCGGSRVFACRSEEDQCQSDADCQRQPGDGSAFCTSEAYGEPWTCKPPECFEGRPLRVGRRALVADTAHREDWCDALDEQRRVGGEEVHLDAARRRTLAEFWARIAGHEHASVASFARFAMEAMALGAPPWLLSRAASAMEDEIRHAAAAYGLASRYAGRQLGPASLELEGVSVGRGVEDFVASLIEDACVGESLAVARACAMRACARDPQVCRVLDRVIEDESRHAALAWRTLAWIAEHHELSETIAQGFDRSLAGVVSPRECDGVARRDAQLEAHGMAPASSVIAYTRQVVDTIVRPAAAQLARRGQTAA